MPVTLVTDHADQADGLLIEQYKNKPRLAALLKGFIDEVQAIENAAYDVIIKRLIDNAEGVQLDTIGEIVGEPRRDHTDAQYRLFIAVRILVNRSNGRASDLLGILDVLEPTVGRLYLDLVPATIMIEFEAPTVLDPYEINALMRQAKGGGVGFVMVVPTDPTLIFEFCDAGASSVLAHACGDAAALDQTFGLVSTII